MHDDVPSRKGSGARASPPPDRQDANPHAVPMFRSKFFNSRSSFILNSCSSTSHPRLSHESSNRYENSQLIILHNAFFTMTATTSTSVVDSTQGYGHFFFAPVKPRIIGPMNSYRNRQPVNESNKYIPSWPRL
jgi:hypothetical protein